MADLIRWEPMGVSSLRQAMDRLFEDSFARSTGLLAGIRGESPAIDMYQTDKEVVVKASVPGMKAEDLEISVTGDMLTLKGVHREEQEVEDENYFRKEMRFGSFMRTLEIPVPTKIDKAEAEFEDGVLTVTLPKTEAVQPKSIKVKPGAKAKEVKPSAKASEAKPAAAK